MVSPLELYECPAPQFAACFLGSQRRHFVEGAEAPAPGAATFGIRPEYVMTEQSGTPVAGSGHERHDKGETVFLTFESGASDEVLR
ncbi:hypothetical protein D2N39_10815 [Gemmobacter lutimaris]|uniref:Uncharacterized protein n=1 Tax=Gemmobacter lutimaris TaxID=2306023 RepID=A0A398BMU6_9RHOB|nr:hypothetical protein D2N39_10815 [Gemmobacter lutimaris]